MLLQWFIPILLLYHLQPSRCRYVQQTTLPPPPPEYFEKFNLDYERYLKEVVAALESDAAFAEKLKNATPEDIQSGKISEALDFVGHGVRSKLDEIKLVEIERLRKKLIERKDRINTDDAVGHLSADQRGFEKDDLVKLIKKVSQDLDMVDAQHHQEFKQHEMDEELQFRHDISNLTAEQQAEAKRKRVEEMNKRAEIKMKHPGSKGQLEDVWEDVDNLPRESFNMKTFFKLHDTNGDGYLDVIELEALFQKELDKVYDPKKDAVEREEELIRMRRHVVEEMDSNKDGLISLEEFVGEEQSPDFENAPDWNPINPTDYFSESELGAYEEKWKADHEYTTVTPHPQAAAGIPPNVPVSVEEMQRHMPGQPVPQAPAYTNQNQQPNVNVQPNVPNPQVQYQQQQQQAIHQQQQQQYAQQQGQPYQQGVPPPGTQYQQQQGVPPPPGAQYQQQQGVPPQQNVQYQQAPPPQPGVQYQQQQQAVPVQQQQNVQYAQGGAVPPANAPYVQQPVVQQGAPQYQQQPNVAQPQVQMHQAAGGQVPNAGQMHNAPPPAI